MRKTLLAIALVGILFSCSTTDEKIIEANNLVNEQLINALDGTKWVLKTCPPQEYLNMNGYSECNYFTELEFSGQSVYIQHNNENAPTLHHICYTEGTKMPLSIQACENPTWKSFFWWDITYLDNKNLRLDVENVSFHATYDEEFTFEKL